MAKLPFQQTQVLPGTEVGGFKSSGISPPPSLQGVIDSGRQFYGAQMDMAESFMDLGQTLAKAVMIDKNKEKREKEIEKDTFLTNKTTFAAEKLFGLEKEFYGDPAGFESAANIRILNTEPSETQSILQGFISEAKEKGYGNNTIAKLIKNIKSLGLHSNRIMYARAINHKEDLYSSLRQAAVKKGENKLFKRLSQINLSILSDKTETLDKEQLQGVKNLIEAVAEEIITIKNGFTGEEFPNKEKIDAQKKIIKGNLTTTFLINENQWNREALNNLQAREGFEETEGLKNALSALSKRFIDAQVLDIINQRDGTYSGDPIEADIAQIASEQAEKVYPRPKKGEDPDFVKRVEYINKVIDALKREFINQDGSLDIDNAIEAVNRYEEEQQEKKRIANQSFQDRRREALRVLGERLSRINADFTKDPEQGGITAEEAEKRADAAAESVYHNFMVLDTFGIGKAEDRKKFKEAQEANNKTLRQDLLDAASSEDRGWMQIQAQREKLELKEQERFKKEERAKFVRSEVNLGVADYARMAAELFIIQQNDPKDPLEFKNALNTILDTVILERAGDGEDIVDDELAKALYAELDEVVIQDWYQTAMKQTADAKDLENLKAQRNYIYGTKDGKPGLNKIIEDAYNLDASWEDTLKKVNFEIKKLLARTTKNLSPGALKDFEKSVTALESSDAKIMSLETRVTDREDEKHKIFLESQMNDIATGKALGDYDLPSQTFRDQKNLLSGSEEGDWQMVRIAALLAPHVDVKDGLYSRDEARKILRVYGERIDRSKALAMIARDPQLAYEKLAPVEGGLPGDKFYDQDLDAIWPNLHVDERARLRNTALNAINTRNSGVKADVKNRFNNEILRVLSGDYQYDEHSEMLDNPSPSFMEIEVKPLVESGDMHQWEYEVMQSKMEYAKEISKAVHGSDEKYGTQKLDYKTAKQLDQLVQDFNPEEYSADFVEKGKRYEVGFMQDVYNTFVQAVNQVRARWKSDGAFYPKEKWKEMVGEEKANIFSKERARFFIKEQESHAPGSKPVLFTNFELQTIDDKWKGLGGEGRGGMLAKMEEEISDPKIFNQMFYDIVEGTDINDSDQLYLEHANSGTILRRLHIAQDMDMASINVKLTSQDTDLATFDVELYGDEDLKQFLAAFSDEPRKMKDWYNLVRSYSIVGMKDGKAEEEIELTVKQLLSSKFHVHSGSPYVDAIERYSVWLPKEFIPDRPKDLGGLMEEQTRFDLITKDDITSSLKKFVTQEVPALVGKNTYPASAAQSYHFRNSDDGQGLTLHYIDETLGSYPVPDKDKKDELGYSLPITLGWKKLMDLIFDVRALGYMPDSTKRISRERIDLLSRRRSYEEHMQLQGNP